MDRLIRKKPLPLPAIHPEPEYRVSGERARWYAEIRDTFQVPWTGVVTMAFAHYPAFFSTLWRGLLPLARSRPFVEGCAQLRALTEQKARELEPGRIMRRLETIGYAPREVDQIRACIEIFSHGNFPYLLTATAARRLLEGHELGIKADAPVFAGRHAPETDYRLVLMEAHHADQHTKAVYEDIERSLGLPFVNTDYRALARWPTYFSLAWRELKPCVDTLAHEEICNDIHRLADQLVGEILPNPGALTSAALCAAAQNDGDTGQIRRVVQLFQWLLPGLVTNVALLRAQLRA